MKKILALGISALTLFSVLGILVRGEINADYPIPYPQKFHIEGNKIIDESENEVVFRGLSPLDIHTLTYHTAKGWEIDIPWSQKSFEKMYEWGAKIVRLPISPGNWRRFNDTEENRSWRIKVIDQAIEWASNYEMYVIIDFHAIGYPRDRGGLTDASEDEFIAFWDEISARYSDNNVVAFYEIFNEPAGLPPYSRVKDWLLWKEFAEKLIEVIRINDPDAVVIVNGLYWGYDLSHVSDYPIERENIIYGTHPYPSKYKFKTWGEAFGNIREKYPVFATEFGFASEGRSSEDSYTGPGRYREAIKTYLEDKNISWTGWCFSCKSHLRLLRDRSYTPTELGVFFWQWLLGEKGITPPEINITDPKDGYLYIFNREIIRIPSEKAIIIGGISIEIETNGDKVEFYIDDVWKNTDNEPPYQWLWDEFAMGRHRITALVYDENGSVALDEREVIIFNIGG